MHVSARAPSEAIRALDATARGDVGETGSGSAGNPKENAQ
jgi:hypothetical protein